MQLLLPQSPPLLVLIVSHYLVSVAGRSIWDAISFLWVFILRALEKHLKLSLVLHWLQPLHWLFLLLPCFRILVYRTCLIFPRVNNAAPVLFYRTGISEFGLLFPTQSGFF